MPEREGDKIIQIGTTVRMFNNPDYELNHIITLGTCEKFDNNRFNLKKIIKLIIPLILSIIIAKIKKNSN